MKVVEYDRLARRPCRCRAAKVDHLSQAPLRLNKSLREAMSELPLPLKLAETPSTDPYPAETELQNIGCHKDCFAPCKHG